MIPRKQNVPGFIDEQGRFRPIRSASYVGSGPSRRKAKVADRKKYSRAKAGDLGKERQERALEDIFDKEIRKQREADEELKRWEKEFEKELRADAYGDGGGRTSKGDPRTLAQFVRGQGGIRRTFRHGGTKSTSGVRSSWDAGEIDRLSHKASGSSGLTTSRTDKGKTLDKMFQSARESGYDVESIDDMLNRIETEIAGGQATYATHGSLTYNPAAVASRLSIGELGRGSYAVMLGKVVLKKFRTRAAAEAYLKSIRERAKKNPIDAEIAAYDKAFDKLFPIVLKRIEGRMPMSRRHAIAKFYGTPNHFESNRTLAMRAVDRFLLGGIWRTELLGPKPNPDLVSTFASLATGVASALHINELMEKRKARKSTKRPAAKRNPKTTAPKVTAKGGDLYVLTIKDGDDTLGIYLHDGKMNGISRKFASIGAARSWASRNKKKLVENPSSLSRLKASLKRALARQQAAAELKKELRAEARLQRVRSRKAKAIAKATANPKSRARRSKANPVKVPRRRTYEMFQGREATTAKPLPVSRHAPARLDQLGDLVELKLNTGRVLKFPGKKYRLCAAGGKLWIAGGKIAKANPAAKTNEINPVGEIDHVVYGTRKPHHGDHAYTHYIHRLGEESGHRPTLCVDREGFPIIRGGRYKIEARGIVN